ncbi:nicotinate-nucleotide--dimethylbenzimidazole phosphoribosyltransferase [uncultured Paludibaculum sp.]|uniref:nicotinate-nucleotide--dimethylbenzimidazole phosphoribosyltransferase n=1 Tax=uncultured Paludibaculum sp. TaxID=1765020 RepID=UPI002AAAC75E|nr:nicotinate-nucleotide--dimethylbenzimidazole phosphoribosyltransferase [uncultured Paludibaculum sp.]
MTLLDQTLQKIEAVDAGWIRKAEARQLELTKPPGSLGRLEEVANRCAAIFQSLSFTVSRPRLVLFAGDHGVCAEGVSPYPPEVTAQMVLNFLNGGAAINCLARTCGVEMAVVDVGVAQSLPAVSGLVRRRVAAGTRNFCAGPAMTSDEVHAAVQVGIEMADEAVADGCELLGFGEMGIGNTTAASALAAALTGLPPSAVIGRGAGADDVCLARKLSAVERALALHAGHLSRPMDMLARIGGLEIAAICGFCLGAAANRRPVLTDGFIATAGAALAVRMHSAVGDYLFASHGSVEPGHAHLLALIGQRPLLDLQMRLGEGTGAALAMKLVQASVAAFTEMTTFTSAGVSDAGQPLVSI